MMPFVHRDNQFMDDRFKTAIATLDRIMPGIIRSRLADGVKLQTGMEKQYLKELQDADLWAYEDAMMAGEYVERPRTETNMFTGEVL